MAPAVPPPPSGPLAAELPRPPPGRTGWPWTTTRTETAPAPAGALPAVTLVTPSFNQAEFLEATIRSVLLQGYPRLEYRVQDGGSTDGSVAVIEKYAPWLSGWASEADRGQAHAINKGLQDASGTILGWLNSDDILLPGALHGVARAFARRPDAVAWAGCIRTVGPEGQIIFPWVAPRHVSKDGIADWGTSGLIPQPACFFSRKGAETVGGLDERYHYALDMEFWLRLASVGTIQIVDELWAQETRHPGAKTMAQRGRLLAEVHVAQLRHGYEALFVQRLGEEMADYEVLKRGSWAARLKHGAYLLASPLLGLWRRASGRGAGQLP